MLRLRKSILGAALLAGLTATSIVTATQAAEARPVWGPHGHWVHGWHDGRYGWWWAGPDFWYWYPAPAYYAYPPVPEYSGPPGPVPQSTWYYCDAANGYYPYVRSCASGWRPVPASPEGRTTDAQAPVPPPPSSPSKS